jgi:hypothetical protein
VRDCPSQGALLLAHLTLLVATNLAAAPAQPKLAIGALSTVKAPPELATFAAEHLAEELRGRGFQVTTAGDMTAVLGLERQKQLMGCSDASSSCLAELASALGVDDILGGQLAKLGDGLQLDLKVLSANNGARLAGFSEHLKDEGQLIDALKRAAIEFARALAPTAKSPAAELVARGATEEDRPLRREAWVPAIAGGALLVGGVVCYAAGHGDYSALAHGTPSSASDWNTRRSRGPVLEGLGVTGIIVGAAGLALASTLYFWPGKSGATQVSVGPQGVSVSGAFR